MKKNSKINFMEFFENRVVFFAKISNFKNKKKKLTNLEVP